MEAQVTYRRGRAVNWVIDAYIHDRVMLIKAMPISVKARRRPPPQKPSHHGDLKRVLMDAALRLVEEGGIEAVNVREAARRAGVSPGAPFRHFESRDALLTAVAEEAQRRFRVEIEAALAAAPAGDPLARFRCIGLAYLRWAVRNPAHFEIISSGKDFYPHPAPHPPRAHPQ